MWFPFSASLIILSSTMLFSLCIRTDLKELFCSTKSLIFVHGNLSFTFFGKMKVALTLCQHLIFYVIDL